jgi:hypothetical protein
VTYPTGRDFWVAYHGTHSEPTFVENAGDGQPGDIQIRTLDSYELTEIDFIKIDVDGYEDLLIKGAQETISQNLPVINIEMKRAKRPGIVRVAEDTLKKLGYKLKIRTKSDEVWLKP